MRAALLLVPLAAACAVGPDYRRPETPRPEAFRSAPPSPAAAGPALGDLPWWELFGDAALRELLKEALASNWDVRRAAARVEEARALTQADAWALLPTVGAQLGGKRQRTLIVPPQKRVFNLFTAQANVAWELDVWGRLRRVREASYAQYVASEEARRAVLAALVADVAQTYFQLRSVDAQLDIARRRQAVREQALSLFRARLQGGTGNRAEVANAEAQVLEVEVQRASLEQRRVQTENALSVLLGRPPGEVRRGLALAEQTLPPEVPPGLPAALLERRPDVRQAEELLVAANAQVGATLADFFPRLSLTGALGFVNPQLAELLAGGPVWNLGGGADYSLPFLGGNRVRDVHEAARARFEQALAAYQQTVLLALREVSDALVAREQLARQVALLERQVAAVEEQRQLAQVRYEGGVANYLEVTTAEERLLPVNLQLVQAREARLTALVQLYRALGGGWQQAQEAEGR